MGLPARQSTGPRSAPLRREATDGASSQDFKLHPYSSGMESVLQYIDPAVPIAGPLGLAGWFMGKTDRLDFGETQGLVVGIIVDFFVTGPLAALVS